MTCEQTIEQLADFAAGELGTLGQHQLATHLGECEQCQQAAYAHKVLREVGNLPNPEPSADLFARVMSNATDATRHSGAVSGNKTSQHFWWGAGVGGAIAASVMAFLLVLNTDSPPQVDHSLQAAFSVSSSQAQTLYLAIDLPESLPGATISLALSGDVILDGYGGEQALSWRADLDKGVNKLSIPVLATGTQGGKLLVRVLHGDKQKMLSVDIDTAS